MPVHEFPLPTTCVRVTELPLLADIGINPDEAGRRQPLVLTIELVLGPARIDAIDQTIDYRRIVEEAEILAAAHIPLIETFGRKLAERCLGYPGVQSARIRVDKPFALQRGLAGVEVSLHKDA